MLETFYLTQADCIQTSENNIKYNKNAI